MYTQITTRPDGRSTSREIEDQKLIDMLVQLHFLRDAGEDISIHTNADITNGWDWSQIIVYRTGKKGTVRTDFLKEEKQ